MKNNIKDMIESTNKILKISFNDNYGTSSADKAKRYNLIIRKYD